MRRAALLICLGLLTGLAGCQAPAATPPAPADPQGIEDLVRAIFAALEAGDGEAAAACILPGDEPFPVLIYDLDLEDQPVKLSGRAGTVSYLESLVEAIQSQGVTVETDITSIHAEAPSPALGYATVDFEQTFTIGDHSEKHTYRATALATTVNGAWKLFHWHGSSAEAAPPAMEPEGGS